MRGAVDRLSGTGRKTILLLYTICSLNQLHRRVLRLPKARCAIFNCCRSHCSAAKPLYLFIAFSGLL